MDESGVTNYKLSKDLPCSPTTVTNWLAGKLPTKAMVARLCEYFGVSAGYLKGETDDRGETKKAPTENGERKNDKLSMLVDLFERLPPDEQNAVIFDLLQKAQAQLDQDSRQ